jgi:hypothetical protein
MAKIESISYLKKSESNEKLTTMFGLIPALLSCYSAVAVGV